MRYLVMECRPGYAIVMDEEGRFKKVVNLSYEVGQKIDKIIEFEEEMKTPIRWPKTLMTVAAAACLCLVLLGSYQRFLLPYGTVRIQINPDVLLSVNSQNNVVKLEGLNEDGKELIEDYSYFWKGMDVVSDELADLAVEKGFLAEGGEIFLDIESEHDDWEVATEKLLISELTIHLQEKVDVEIKPKTNNDSGYENNNDSNSENQIIIQPGDSLYDDDDYEASDSNYENTNNSSNSGDSQYESSDSVYSENVSGDSSYSDSGYDDASNNIVEDSDSGYDDTANSTEEDHDSGYDDASGSDSEYDS